jgi:hypothetical protein
MYIVELAERATWFIIILSEVVLQSIKGVDSNPTVKSSWNNPNIVKSFWNNPNLVKYFWNNSNQVKSSWTNANLVKSSWKNLIQ